MNPNASENEVQAAPADTANTATDSSAAQASEPAAQPQDIVQTVSNDASAVSSEISNLQSAENSVSSVFSAGKNLLGL